MVKYNYEKYENQQSLLMIRQDMTPSFLEQVSDIAVSSGGGGSSLTPDTPYNETWEVFENTNPVGSKWRDFPERSLGAASFSDNSFNTIQKTNNYSPTSPIIEGFNFDIGGAIRNAFNDLVDRLKDLILDPVENWFHETVNNIINPIQGWFNDTVNNIINPIRGWFENMISTITDWFNKIKDFITDLTNTVIQKFKDIGEKIVQIYENIRDQLIRIYENIKSQLEDAFAKITDSFNSIFRKIENAYRTLIQRFDLLIDAFDDVEDGLKGEFNAIGDVLKAEIEDVECVVKGGTDCAQHYVNNFRGCSSFYFLDFLHQILYGFFIRLPVWLIQTITGFNLMPTLQQIYDILSKIDKQVLKQNLGFSVLHFPENITKTCYTCPVDLESKVNRLSHDNKVCFKQWLNEPIQNFHNAADKFRGVFSTNF